MRTTQTEVTMWNFICNFNWDQVNQVSCCGVCVSKSEICVLHHIRNLSIWLRSVCAANNKLEFFGMASQIAASSFIATLTEIQGCKRKTKRINNSLTTFIYMWSFWYTRNKWMDVIEWHYHVRQFTSIWKMHCHFSLLFSLSRVSPSTASPLFLLHAKCCWLFYIYFTFVHDTELIIRISYIIVAKCWRNKCIYE